MLYEWCVHTHLLYVGTEWTMITTQHLISTIKNVYIYAKVTI